MNLDSYPRSRPHANTDHRGHKVHPIPTARHTPHKRPQVSRWKSSVNPAGIVPSSPPETQRRFPSPSSPFLAQLPHSFPAPHARRPPGPHLGCGVRGCPLLQQQQCHLLVVVMRGDVQWGQAVLQRAAGTREPRAAGRMVGHAPRPRQSVTGRDRVQGDGDPAGPHPGLNQPGK